MRSPTQVLQRATVGLWLVSTLTATLAIGCYLAARRAVGRGERELVLMTNDVVRATQAKVAAERMVAVGRTYLLTHEPDLLARAQAAETKLDLLLQSLATNPHSGEERTTLGGLAGAARQYHDAFATAVTSGPAPLEPRLMADVLRQQLLPARDRLESELDRLIDEEERRSAAVRTGESELAWRSADVILPIGVIGTLGSAFCAWIVFVYAKSLLMQESGDRPERPVRAPSSPDREAPRPTPHPASDQPPPADSSERPRPPAGRSDRRRFPGEPTWWPPS